MTLLKKQRRVRRIVRRELNTGPEAARSEELARVPLWRVPPGPTMEALLRELGQGPEMRTVERLTASCLYGDHQRKDAGGRLRGCAGMCLGNDPTTKIGNYAGEQVRVRCTCECHSKPKEREPGD